MPNMDPRIRRSNDTLLGQSADFISADPYLAPGQMAFAPDTNDLRIGPGNWSILRAVGPAPLGSASSMATGAFSRNDSQSLPIPGLAAVEFEVTDRPWHVQGVTYMTATAVAGARSGFASLVTTGDVDERWVSSLPPLTDLGEAGGPLGSAICSVVIATPGEYSIQMVVGRLGSGAVVFGSDVSVPGEHPQPHTLIARELPL